MSRETDLAWLAGFFDGEGSITIVRSLKKNTFAGRIGMGQKDRGILDCVLNITARYDITGNGPYEGHYKTTLAKNPVLWRIEYNAQKGRSFLLLILPYMKEALKIERAEFYIYFFGLSKKGSSHGNVLRNDLWPE